MNTLRFYKNIRKGEITMEAIVKTPVCMAKLEARAAMSVMDCNQRNLCMDTYR